MLIKHRMEKMNKNLVLKNEQAKKPEHKEFKEIKPETNMTVEEAKSFINGLFGC